MGGDRSLRVACVTPRGVKKMLFRRVIESVVKFSYCGVTRISVGGLIWHRWTFFFFSLLPRKLQFSPFNCWHFNFNPYYFGF